MSSENVVKVQSQEAAEEIVKAEEEAEKIDGEGIDEENVDDEEEDEDDEDEEDFDGSDEEEEDFDVTLSKVQIVPITLQKEKYVPDFSQLPESYKENNKQERQAITYCKRFVLHYNHLCDERRPLFLMPKNECDVKKIVCSTIRPTQLPYRDLLDWPDIATFVAQYVVYDKLDKPLELPKTLYAPQTVLQRRRGHCFDLSTLLCSMLIGSGYNAYVVSGYASREVCNFDLTYTRCPIIEEDKKVYPKSLDLTICRYTVRPPKSYTSEYQLRLKMKQDKAYKAAMDEFHEKKEEMRKLLESPPPDPLRGYRVHSWVMVMPGQRDIHQTFYIEPTTGFSHPTTWEEYLGIESLWNPRNYYVNVQEGEGNDLPSTIAKLRLDISDSRYWEYIFPGQGLHYKRKEIPKSEARRLSFMKHDICEEEIPLGLPDSWALPMKLSRDEYDDKYPMGKTSWLFKKARLDFFTPYMLHTGLVKKLTVYYDLECTKVEYTIENFAHRHDLLKERFTHQNSGKTIEYFATGRDDFLKEHQYLAHSPEPESPRTLIFLDSHRLDQMYKREESKTFIKEWYNHRPDRKVFKETIFGPNGRVYEEGEGPDSRLIEYVILRFSRDKSIPANEDIEELTFSVCNDEIDIIYHVEDHRIVRSTRHFTKPDRWWDDTIYLDWKPELHWNFEADIYAKPKSELKLYQMLVRLMHMEVSARSISRKSEKETRKLLNNRNKEEGGLKLVRTYNDADRIPEKRVQRLKEKARIRDEKMIKKLDIDRDYMEPYLHRLGLTLITNKRQAMRVRDDLMEDLRGRFLYQMELMKDAYEAIKQDVGMMQETHAQEITMLPTWKIAEYDSQLATTMFTAHILEERMNQFKISAPIKYKAMFSQVMRDPRMMSFL